jgi:single-strand DNA-binding protein
MLNQAVLVGRIARDLEVRETENGAKVSNLTLAIPRSYKNADGVYETDFVDVTLWAGVAENTAEYCRKGDIVGVKGRLQTRIIETEDTKKRIMELVAEKVTFLSSKKED